MLVCQHLHSRLFYYLARIHATLYSRSDIVEDLRLVQRSNEEGQVGDRLRYYDGSVLEFREAFVVERRRIIKLDYTGTQNRHSCALQDQGAYPQVGLSEQVSTGNGTKKLAAQESLKVTASTLPEETQIVLLDYKQG